MVRVRVPASSANVGSGFDSFGIALNLYNTITAEETESGLNIVNIGSDTFLPTGENNLIYRSIIRVFDEVNHKKKGIKITQKSDIPVTRGLGSSSACIVGGLIAGNILSGEKLNMQQIFELANELEGHPDNVAPAIFGGFCISCKANDRLIRRTIRLKQDVKFVAMIPQYYVETKKSRIVLPKKIDFADASFNISRAAETVYSFMTGDYSNFRDFCDDRLHQCYRKKLIDHMEEIIEKSYSFGAYGAFLSGSGPTIIAMIDKNDKTFAAKMQDFFEKENIKRKCRSLYCDNVGVIAASNEF